MSRFFVSGYSSESGSSDEEDLLSTSEEELLGSSEESELEDDSEFEANDSDDSDDDDSDSDAPKGPAYFLKKDFMKGGAGSDSDSDSDDDSRKVVKSAKEKLLDDMRASIETINTNKRTNDYIAILSEFEKLGRFLIRANQQNFGIPNFYYKLLGDLEDFNNEATINEKESGKKLNAAQSRAFNTFKQRIKKQIKEYQPYIDLYRAEPELFDNEEPLDHLITPAVSAKEAETGANKVLSPIFATLKQIAETRGKKNIDKYEQISELEGLVKDGQKPFELISAYQMLLSIRFDASSNQAFMPNDLWKQNQSDINSLLDLLESKSSEYQVSELGTATEDIDIEPAPNANGVRVIYGSIASYVERLDDEFTRSLQNSDPHSIEYIERLKDEGDLYKLLVRVQVYVESTTPESIRGNSEGEQLARIVSRRLEHIYYKPDQLIKVNESEAWKSINGTSSIVGKDAAPSDVINKLTEFLSKQQNPIYSKRGLLSSIYYYAVNNKYQIARDLFLNSQVYASIHHADSSLQVQYNRALVQLGLGAFRAGEIEESHQALNEITNSQRLKELLGQGFSSKYPSQATTAEKQKLLPFHMHINLELLECVYMTSSLLIEIPALAAASNSPKDSKRKASLKSFKSKLEFHDRQYFTGPPESIKDHLVHASRSLQKGDWSKAYQLLASIKIWKLLPDSENLLVMLKNQLKIEGLRTYIFTYKSVFSKLSVAKLSQTFDTDSEKVVSILDKMVESGDIQGSFSEEKTFINFVTDERQRTKLQELAIVLNEKVRLLTEKNEKTSSNGHSRKQPLQQQQQQQQQKEQQKEQKELLQEENNKFRYANVNSNNDEFQATS